MTTERTKALGTSRSGVFASSERLTMSSNPMYAKNITKSLFPDEQIKEMEETTKEFIQPIGREESKGIKKYWLYYTIILIAIILLLIVIIRLKRKK